MAFVEWPPRNYEPSLTPRDYVFPPMPKDSNPLRIGLIGAGGRGGGMMSLFCEHPWATCVAVADPLPDRREEVCGHLAKMKVSAKPYEDYRKMLASPDVDAVLIATPDYVHCENVKEAIAAGKHIFCEKPLAINVADCDDMLRAHAARPDLVFGVGLCLRFTPICQAMHQMIADGEIGDIKIAYVVDSVAPGGRYYYHDWHRLKKNICSLLVQKGCHTLDIMNWCIDSVPRQVFASGRLAIFGGNERNDLTCGECKRFDCPERMPDVVDTDFGLIAGRKHLCCWSKEIDVPDNSTLITTYENGVRMTYTEIHFTPHYSREFTFVGDKGQLYANTLDGRIEVRRRHAAGRVETIYPGKRAGGHSGGDPGVVHEFLSAVREKRQPITDIVAGRWCTVLAISAEESIEGNKLVQIADVPAETKRTQKGRK